MLSCSQVVLPLISIPYVSRILDPGGIGKVSFIDSLAYYFITIAEFGIIVYGIREVARVKDDKVKLQKLVSELLLLHIITSSVTLILYAITVIVLWQKIGDMRLVLFSFSFLLVNFFSCEWYFWGTEKFKYITIRSLVTRLLGLISLFILVKAPADYYLYYAIIAFPAMGNMAWNAITVFREVPVSFKNTDWKRHIKYTWVTWLVSIFYSVLILLDVVLLRIASASAAAAGLYAFSIKIVRIGSSVLTDMFLVLYPRTVSQLKHEKMEEVQQTIIKSVQLIILLSIPACAGVYLLSGQFTEVFFGQSFSSISDNLKILALLPFIKAYSLFLSKQVLISWDKEKLYLKSLVIGTIVFVALALLLSHYYQDKGACYAIMITELLIMLLNFYYVKQTMPALKIFDWPALAQALCGILLFVPVVYLSGNYIKPVLPSLLVSIIVCAGLYFLFLLFVWKNRLLYSFYETAIIKRRVN